MDLRVYLIIIVFIGKKMCVNAIDFINEAQDTVVPKDSARKIKCEVNEASVNYSWLILDVHSGAEQLLVPSPNIYADSRGILIVGHNPSVVGRYRCKAVIAGTDTVVSRLFRIDIEGLFANKLTERQLGSGDYKVGSIAILICPFWSVPRSQATFKWFAKTSSGRRQILFSETLIPHRNGKLLEMKVDALSFGSYHCEVAKFGLKERGPDVEINQTEGSKNEDFLTWIAKPIESFSLLKNELDHDGIKVDARRGTITNIEGTKTLELICAASSKIGGVEVMWLKDGNVIDRASFHIHRLDHEVRGQGTLVLLNTAPHYSGRYTCKVVSLSKRKEMQTSLVLVVKAPLRFINKPDSIIIGDKNKEILLSCRTNDPDARSNISWRKNGEIISSNQYVLQRLGSLRIPRMLARDEGAFQCLVDDEFSSIQAIVQLKLNKVENYVIRDNRPLPVRNLRVRAVTFRTLNISWNHASEGFESILHYNIVLLDLSDLLPNKKKITIKADRLESHVLVENLVPDSFYRIYVTSVNGSGTSNPAMIKSSPRVLSKPPLVSPSKVYVTDIGSGVAKVHWTPPPENKMNGELLGHSVLLSSADGIYSNTIDVDKGSQTLHLSDLIPDTKYSVRVQALTRGGRGPLSLPVAFDTTHSSNKHDLNFRQILPSRPTKDDQRLSDERFTGLPILEIRKWSAKGLNTSIYLQWSHPINGISVRRYKVKWGKVYPGPYEVTIKYPTSSYVIENLDPGTQYMIKVIPISDVGEGKELLISQSTWRVDLKAVPIPLNLAVRKVEVDSATISWEDPSSDIRGTRLYQVRYGLLDGDLLKASLSNTSESKMKISGLLPSTSYAFSVRSGDVFPTKNDDYARTAWVWSEWSLKETFHTIGERPRNGVRDLTIATVGRPDLRDNEVYTNVIVSWSSPYRRSDRTFDEIIGYSVMFTDTPQIDPENWNVQILPRNQFSSLVSLNGNGRVYYFRVGCRTSNFQCPLSRYLLYKTADGHGMNHGLLQVPEKYHYTLDVPARYLQGDPQKSLGSDSKPHASLSRDLMWLVAGISFGAVVFLVMLMVIVIIVCRKSRSGYKLGRKASLQLMANQSPIVSTGKASPHAKTFYNHLKSPDLFPHTDQTHGDADSEDQDNDFLHFASVSQSHLASATQYSNMVNPSVQIRANNQIVFYPEMSAQAKTGLNHGTAINSPPNPGNPPYPYQSHDPSYQQMRMQSAVQSFPNHPFTQHLLSNGSPTPPCSSTCLQPARSPPQTVPHSPPNTPRINANCLSSRPNLEDVRQSRSRGTAASTPRVIAQASRDSNGYEGGPSRTSADAVRGLNSEELSLEIANLEGLMKDLNTITQKEFEC